VSVYVVPFWAVKVKTPVAAEPPKHPVMLLGLLEVAPLWLLTPLWPGLVVEFWVPIVEFCVPVVEFWVPIVEFWLPVVEFWVPMDDPVLFCVPAAEPLVLGLVMEPCDPLEFWVPMDDPVLFCVPAAEPLVLGLVIEPWDPVEFWVPMEDPVLFCVPEVEPVLLGLAVEPCDPVVPMLDPDCELSLCPVAGVEGEELVDCDPLGVVVVVVCVVVVLVWELGAVWPVLVVLASCASTHVPQQRRTAVNALFTRMYSLLDFVLRILVE
jgi:hypothetical protein